MDPSSNLQEQREIVKRLLDDADEFGTIEINPFDAKRLADLVLALDEWLTKGGSLPAQWWIVHEKIAAEFSRGYTRNAEGI